MPIPDCINNEGEEGRFLVTLLYTLFFPLRFPGTLNISTRFLKYKKEKRYPIHIKVSRRLPNTALAETYNNPST